MTALVVRVAGVAGVAVLGLGFVDTGCESNQHSVAGAPLPARSCEVRREGDRELVGVSTIVGDDTLTMRTSSGDDGADGAIAIAIGGSPYLSATWSRSPSGALHVVTRYGRAFHGVAEEILDSSDGRTVTGQRDGRPIEPYAATAGATAVRFADGTPTSVVVVDDAAKRVAEILANQARDELSACTGGTVTGGLDARAGGEERCGSSSCAVGMGANERGEVQRGRADRGGAWEIRHSGRQRRVRGARAPRPRPSTAA